MLQTCDVDEHLREGLPSVEFQSPGTPPPDVLSCCPSIVQLYTGVCFVFLMPENFEATLTRAAP